MEYNIDVLKLSTPQITFLNIANQKINNLKIGGSFALNAYNLINRNIDDLDLSISEQRIDTFINFINEYSFNIDNVRKLHKRKLIARSDLLFDKSNNILHIHTYVAGIKIGCFFYKKNIKSNHFCKFNNIKITLVDPITIIHAKQTYINGKETYSSILKHKNDLIEIKKNWNSFKTKALISFL